MIITDGRPSPDRGVNPPAKDISLPPDRGSTSPSPKALPKPTKPCPNIVEGAMRFLGVKVQVWVAPKIAASKRGPLIFYWHGTGSSSLEVFLGLPPGEVGAIKAQGGVVVAPEGPTGLPGGSTGGIVWKAGDFKLADEILGCVNARFGIDPRRIHSMGMSAGGLHTTQMSYGRAGYLASVATYSGGLIPILPPPPSQDPHNKLAAMIFHGGAGDALMGFSFKTSSERYLKDLRGKGHFAFICGHTAGHWLPPGGGAGAWRFFQDHRFGAPSRYRKGLPPAIPRYCKL